MDRERVFRTESPEATGALGEALARVLVAGDWLALTGPLGAGKTTLVAGLARGLGFTGVVRSPSYALVSVYPTRPTLVHADFYRLNSPLEADELALQEAAPSDDAIIVVEWADRFPQALPENYTEIVIEAEADKRTLRVEPRGAALSDRWRKMEEL